MERGKDKIVRNIEKRIADVTFIPIGMYFLPFASFSRVLIVDKTKDSLLLLIFFASLMY